MSVNSCLTVFSRLLRHFNRRSTRIPACGFFHASPGLLQRHNEAASLDCRRNVSSNSCPPKSPDTSLFVPVSVKTDFAADGSVGVELSQPLNKGQ